MSDSMRPHCPTAADGVVQHADYWLDRPNRKGWWDWREDGDGEAVRLLIVGDERHYEVADDSVLADELGRDILEEENYWEMTDVDEMPGKWRFVEPKKHADHAEAGGREVPDSPGFWTRETQNSDRYAIVVFQYTPSDLLWAGWHGRMREQGHIDHLPIGNWKKRHPAPSDAAELRAKIRELESKHYEQPWTANEAEQLRAEVERLRAADANWSAAAEHERDAARVEIATITARAEAAEADRDQLRAKLAEVELINRQLSIRCPKCDSIELDFSSEKPGCKCCSCGHEFLSEMEQLESERDQLAERVAVLEGALRPHFRILETLSGYGEHIADPVNFTGDEAAAILAALAAKGGAENGT